MGLISQPSAKNPDLFPYCSDANWFPVNKLPPLAFDHHQIIPYAVKRLQAKLSYTNIAYSLLPPEFTISELQEIYETILGSKLDKRNFRKKILNLDLIKEIGKRKAHVSFRPPKLYQFINQQIVFY
jgi:8-oxo-dGTP diphosphatase